MLRPLGDLQGYPREVASQLGRNELMIMNLTLTPYFNSLIKTVINRRYNLNDSFEEILNLLDRRIIRFRMDNR